MRTVASGHDSRAITSTGEALATELADVVDGEVRFDSGTRALYAYDASIFRQVPIGVVIPRHEQDVVAALEVCRRHGAPVLPRGCGTALAGQAVNAAVVFDFSKYLNTLVHLDAQAGIARVQPGLICDELRDAAEEYQLTFGPDPATHDHATLGGMIGNNSCGTHSVMAGKTADNVLEMDIVTYDGVRIRVGPTTDEELTAKIRGGGRIGDIYAAMAHLRDTYADDIRSGLPDIPRRVSGYNLDQLLPENGFNVAGALIGTEGTCAITLGATVKLVPSPPKRSLVVLGYPDIPSSGYDVPWLLQFDLIALEFTSRHVIENMHAKGLSFGEDRLPDGAAWLLVEFGGQSQDEADEKAERLFAALDERGGEWPRRRLYEDPASESAAWEIRRHSAGTSRMPVELGDHGGWPNWEDAAVAPDRLGDYLTDYLKLMHRYDYDGVFFGHWGQGCIHCRIDYDLRTPKGIRTYRRFMEQAADLVVSYGGSLSGEHGDGHGRAELWPKMFPPRLMQAFTDFKRIWDPDNRMNPGKLIEPYRLDEHLREGASFAPLSLDTAFSYPLDGHDFASAVGRCFGVGKCRHLTGGVMCPSFMVTREEKHSTRGRARLLQEMAQASGPVKDRWRSDEVKDSLELCLACKGCKGDCPVKVDVATYKAEFLHHYYKGRLRPRQAYALGLIPYWARLASHAPRLANLLTHGRGIHRLVKAAGGVAADREPPRFAQRTFRDWFDSDHTDRNAGGDPVLLWPDTFVNFFEPNVGIATVEVLEAAGFRVRLPPPGLCCGRPFYDYGMLSLAKHSLSAILRALREDIRAGIPMVGMEPSCVAVFRDELSNLFPSDADAQRLSAQTFALSEYLTTRAPEFRLPHLPRQALVQGHCHHRSVMGFDAEEQVLDQLGLDVQIPDSGCCGMAGSFGYEAGERYAVSVAAGERVLLPAVRAAAPDTLILADGFSCRSQIKSGAQRHALHLAEVIALGLRDPGGDPPGANRTVASNGDRRTWIVPAAGAAAMAAGVGAVARRQVRSRSQRRLSARRAAPRTRA